EDGNPARANIKQALGRKIATILFTLTVLPTLRRFGNENKQACLVTILNTLDSLGKFDGKVDEGFLVGYFISSKAIRLFNSRTRIVQETLHVNFLENKHNVAVEESDQHYVLFPVWSSGSTNPYNTDEDVAINENELEFEGRRPESEVNVSPIISAQSKKHNDKTKREATGKSPVESFIGYRNLSAGFEDFSNNIINEVNVVGILVPAVGQLSSNSTNTFSTVELEDITYSDDEDDVGAEANFNNLETSIIEELLQFKMQKVWVLVDLPHRKRDIGTKWVFRNKKDERGIMVRSQRTHKWSGARNKARLVAQGHTQEEGIDYEEVFAPVARIEAIRLFLAYASFMGFMVYQIDVKSAFLYGTIEEEVYVCQPLEFEDPDYPDKVCKVVKALYGLHRAPRACQDKYVAEILKKFGLTDRKSASTPIDTGKPLLKDPDDEDVNDVTRLQALVDKKKVVITKASIRDALRLDDAEGIECLPNEEIFIELARIGYKKPSTKLTIYKAFFSSQVGKGFSGVDTPLFEGMLVAQEVGEDADEVHAEDVPTVGVVAEGAVSDDDDGISMNLLQNLMDICITLTRRVEHLELDKIAQALKITELKQRVKKLERRNKLKIDADKDVVLEDAKDVVVEKSADVEDNADIQWRKRESQAKIYKIDLEHAKKIITEVVTAASDTITAASTTITAADVPIPAATITNASTLTTAPSRKRKRVVIRDPQETTTTSTIIHSEAKSKDKGKGVMVEEPKPLKKKAQIEQDKAYARELEAKLNKNIDWDEVIDHIVPNDEDDVYTEATLIARKVPVVDYEIYNGNNKPYYKIKRVGERFATTKPKNFSDDFLLITLRAMFEKPDIQAQIWKNQRSVHGQAKVKSWKLLESCEEGSEVSLELLSFGVDAAMDFKENMLVFNAPGERISAAKPR
nr:retrovirus-related Pol polyprotein from transposon TNT 1-94 [Tanacetum cinerariifolium]